MGSSALERGAAASSRRQALLSQRVVTESHSLFFAGEHGQRVARGRVHDDQLNRI
jgi:hypothetical protein